MPDVEAKESLTSFPTTFFSNEPDMIFAYTLFVLSTDTFSELNVQQRSKL